MIRTGVFCRICKREIAAADRHAASVVRNAEAGLPSFARCPECRGEVAGNGWSAQVLRGIYSKLEGVAI